MQPLTGVFTMHPVASAGWVSAPLVGLRVKTATALALNAPAYTFLPSALTVITSAPSSARPAAQPGVARAATQPVCLSAPVDRSRRNVTTAPVRDGGGVDVPAVGADGDGVRPDQPGRLRAARRAAGRDASGGAGVLAQPAGRDVAPERRDRVAARRRDVDAAPVRADRDRAGAEERRGPAERAHRRAAAGGLERSTRQPLEPWSWESVPSAVAVGAAFAATAGAGAASADAAQMSGRARATENLPSTVRTMVLLAAKC